MDIRFRYIQQNPLSNLLVQQIELKTSKKGAIHMLRNYYTVFISSPQAGKARQFSCHKSTPYLSIFLLLLFLIGDGIAVLKYYESYHLRKENGRLKTENKKLQKIALIVDEIEKEKSLIRDFLGLEEPDSSMGGPEGGEVDPYFTDTSLNFPQDGTSPMPRNTSQHKQTPIERALCLKKSLEGIVEDLIDRKDEWDRTPTLLPVDTDEYLISSCFGWRESPFTGRREFHSGLDISSRRGTPIVAPADGRVIEVGEDRYLGKFIRISHSENLTTLYGHLLEQKVTKGVAVKRGDLIGLMGNTGKSTGHHLHYGVQVDNKSVDPSQYILNTPARGTILAKG